MFEHERLADGPQRATVGANTMISSQRDIERNASADQLAFLRSNRYWIEILDAWCEGFDEGERGASCLRKPEPIRLKVPEAAQLASMSPRALWHLIQRGQLPRGVVIHAGRSVWLDRERFLKAIRQSSPGRVNRHRGRAS